jgi:hypothetical protein
MESSRTSNNVISDDLDYIIAIIDDEILFLNKLKMNLRKFAYMESLRGTIIFVKFNYIIDEICRITLEVSVLEQKKNEYIKIKENLAP